ncbi:MAG: 30S ribosomal protein S16 [Verrucomicrobiales bacterium]|jgi:small subunit ribosomal protein S16|nr:30S ribosomal protein S16 [Verrucomicrobiales bacterium]
MAVVIRLRREGARNRPFYNVVVADKRSPRDGKFIEIVGSYDPVGKNQEKQLKLDRVEHWLGQGAKASDTVRSLVKKARTKAKAAAA